MQHENNTAFLKSVVIRLNEKGKIWIFVMSSLVVDVKPLLFVSCLLACLAALHPTLPTTLIVSRQVQVSPQKVSALF